VTEVGGATAIVVHVAAADSVETGLRAATAVEIAVATDRASIPTVAIHDHDSEMTGEINVLLRQGPLIPILLNNHSNQPAFRRAGCTLYPRAQFLRPWLVPSGC
jgi:hypothetical protein